MEARWVYHLILADQSTDAMDTEAWMGANPPRVQDYVRFDKLGMLCESQEVGMIETAVWIIAICEVLRMLQNALQLYILHRDANKRDNAYAEFINSLRYTDRQYVRKMLDEFEKREGNDD